MGHYLVLAAINRAAWPKSKRAFAEWYQGTVLARLVPALPDELRSQRFWDHMDLFAPEHFAPIQRELLGRIHARFPLGAQFLVYDTTNYYTFIHTFNSRPSLPQRGKNKQKRADLRQLSLALVVDEAQGLPLYYRCYEGNVTDVVALGASLQEMVGQFLPQTASPVSHWCWTKAMSPAATSRPSPRPIFLSWRLSRPTGYAVFTGCP